MLTRETGGGGGMGSAGGMGDGLTQTQRTTTIRTKRYLNRGTPPFADFGPPLDRAGWTQIVAVGVGVALGALLGKGVLHDPLGGGIYGLAVGVVVAWFSEQNREPYVRQLSGYAGRFLARRWAFAAQRPAPPSPWPLGDRRAPTPLRRLTWRMRWLPRRVRWALVHPAPAWHLLVPQGTRPGAIQQLRAEEGRLVRPDGRAVALAQVTPINSYARREDDERAASGRQIGEIPALLSPRQRAQLLIVNRATPAEVALADYDRRQVGTTDVEREYVAARRAALERRYAEAHVPDTRFYIAVEQETSVGLDALRQRMSGVRRTGRRVQGRLQRRLRPSVLRLCRRSAVVAEDVPHSEMDQEPDHAETERTVAFALQVDEVYKRVRQAGAPVRPLSAGEAADTLIRTMGAVLRADQEIPGARCDCTGESLASVSPLHQAACALDATERPTHLRLRRADGTTVYARSLVVRQLPSTVDYGWLAPLAHLPFMSDVAVYYEGRSQTREEGKIERKATTAFWMNEERKGRGGTEKVRLSRAEAEHKQTLAELDDPDIEVHACAIIVTLYADTTAQLRRRTAVARATVRGLTKAWPGAGWGHQLPLWLATRPLCLGDDLATLPELTPVLRTLFPCTTENPGDTGGMPAGVTLSGREAVHLDWDAAGIGTQQMGVGGLPSSGKSVWMNACAAWSYLEGPPGDDPQGGNGVTILDRSGSYRALCDLVGGTYLTLLDEQAEPPALNPYELVIKAIPTKGGRVARLLTLHERMYGHGDVSERMTAWQYQKVAEGLDAILQRRRRGRYPYPLERDLIAHLRAEAIPSERRTEMDDLLAGLLPYVGDGPWASLADRPTSVALGHRFLVFDTRQCSEGRNAVVAFWLMETAVAWRARERAGHRRVDGRAALETEIIDEGWSVLQVAAPHIQTVALTSRHVRRRVIFGLQFISNLADDPLGQALFDVVPYWCIFKLRNERAGHGTGTAWLAEPLGVPVREARALPDLQIDEGRSAQMLFVVRGHKGTRYAPMSVELAEEDIEVFKSHPHERDAREAMVARHGGLWPAVKAAAEATRRARARAAQGRGGAT